MASHFELSALAHRNQFHFFMQIAKGLALEGFEPLSRHLYPSPFELLRYYLALAQPSKYFLFFPVCLVKQSLTGIFLVKWHNTIKERT